ncbi:MAG: trimethylamine methyltransferase family protein [Proteobacteria bacterium]|nr:trimethylamine methyltransferase family protein [Pseudomonadota bacterium]
MRRAAARKREQWPVPPVVERALHVGQTLPYNPVQPEEADRVVKTAMQLLAEIGVRFEPGTEADALLRAAGCEVLADGVVKIPEAVVERALATVARSVKLWNRDGTAGIDIDDRHTWFMPGMTCIKVYDEVTGEPRDSTRDDLALITRIADGLPNIDAICVACKDVPNSTMAGEIGEFACMAENSTKPLEFLCEYPESLQAAIDMAAAIRGSHEALAAKPYFLQIVTPLPVFYAQPHIDQVIIAARAGIPVSVGTLAIGGASSPITTAGCLVHCLATDFAGMVLGQAAKPGSFCIGSTNPYFMEPATGGIGNLPQTMLGEQIMCQIRRQMSLPSFTGLGGEAKSRRFNQDAVFEIAAMMGQIFHTRPATCDYLGSLDQGITYSLHALLLCDDMAGMLRTLWRGTVIDDDTLALSVVRDIGLFGNFLGHEHTARHCRSNMWGSRYFGGNEPLSTSGKEERDLMLRIDDDLQDRLRAAPPPALSPLVQAEIDAIQARFQA